jgi:hypothetical protein
MAVAKPPIFIVDGNDVIVHSTLEDAALWLEPSSIGRNDYGAYDSEGRLLNLEPAGLKVKVSLAEELPQYANKLEEALRSYLKAVDDPAGNDPRCDLQCLVEACRKFIVPRPTSPWAALKMSRPPVLVP